MHLEGRGRVGGLCLPGLKAEASDLGTPCMARAH